MADLTEWHLKMIHGFTYMQPQEQSVFFNLFRLENFVVTYLKFSGFIHNQDSYFSSN